MEFLIVVDMQNDFIDGSLGTPEAVAVVPSVLEKVKNFSGEIVFTRDTHSVNYLSTYEGKNLPVEHCIKGTYGWQIRAELDELRTAPPVDKPTFGSVELALRLKDYDENTERISGITLVGLCTDICVISNAMLIKAFMPETDITVDASCCAGVTPESHLRALESMKACQINIVNE